MTRAPIPASASRTWCAAPAPSPAACGNSPTAPAIVLSCTTRSKLSRKSWASAIDFASTLFPYSSSTVEAAMAPAKPAETVVKHDPRKSPDYKSTEEQVDVRGTVGQRIDNKGTKIEDEAGTGKIDSEGGDRKSTRLNSSHLGISYAV